MKKGAIFGGALCIGIAAAASVYLWLQRPTDDVPGIAGDARHTQGAKSRPLTEETGGSEAEETISALPGNASRPSDSTNLLAVIGNRHAYNPEDESNDATSEEDAEWLHRNGFPDPFAYHHLRRASIPELERAAEEDLRAQVILAYNMAVSGQYGNRPIELLRDASAKGSIFALVTWGDIHFSLDQYRNQALGAAYYQLATRRGYFTAAGKKYAMAGGLSAEQRLLSDLYTEAAWMEIQALRRQRGLRPFDEPDMRPGFGAYLSAIQQGLLSSSDDQAGR